MLIDHASKVPCPEAIVDVYNAQPAGTTVRGLVWQQKAFSKNQGGFQQKNPELGPVFKSLFD